MPPEDTPLTRWQIPRRGEGWAEKERNARSGEEPFSRASQRNNRNRAEIFTKSVMMSAEGGRE